MSGMSFTVTASKLSRWLDPGTDRGKRVMCVEGSRELETNCGWADDSLDLERANESRSQFSGSGLEWYVPG